MPALSGQSLPLTSGSDLEVNLTSLFQEVLDLKNEIVKMEMREKEIKKKFSDMHRLLATDRTAANKIFCELKKWANT